MKLKRLKRAACIDSSYIEGTFIQIAKRYKEKQREIKISLPPRISELMDRDVILFIDLIGKYEIMKKMIKAYNLSFQDANNIFTAVLNKHPHLNELITLRGDKKATQILTEDFINSALKILPAKGVIHTPDLIHIAIAKTTGVPIITSERKALPLWKKVYGKSMGPEEALKHFKK